MTTREEWYEERYHWGDFFDLPFGQISAIIDRSKEEVLCCEDVRDDSPFEHLERRMAALEEMLAEPEAKNPILDWICSQCGMQMFTERCPPEKICSFCRRDAKREREPAPNPEPAPEDTVCVNLIPSRLNSGELYLRTVKYGQALRPECLLECRVVPDSGNITRLEPVAVREAQDLRKEVERLEDINRGFSQGRDELEAEVVRLENDCADGRAELAKMSEERDSSTIGKQIVKLDEGQELWVLDRVAEQINRDRRLMIVQAGQVLDIQAKYDKLLLLASRVRTAWNGYRGQYLGHTLDDALTDFGAHVAESDPKAEDQ